MNAKKPISTLECAKKIVAQAVELDRQADLLIDRLADEHRPPNYAGICLRRDWGSNKLPQFELLRLAIQWCEEHQDSHFPEAAA